MRSAILAMVAAAGAITCIQSAALVPRCQLGSSKVNVSCIAIGTLHTHELGSPEAVAAYMRTGISLGITTWDTSDVYNSMPSLLGAALQTDATLRPQIEVIAKMDITGALGGFGFDSGSAYDTSAAHLDGVLQTYLTALNTSYLDVVLLHRQDYLLNIPALRDTVLGWLTSGVVRAFGVSNFDMPTFTALAQAGIPLAANEIELSPLTPDAIYDGRVSYHYGQGNTVLAWSPLGGDPWGQGNRLFGIGSLNGTPKNARIRTGLGNVAALLNTTADVAAIAWLLRHPAPIIPILGTTNPARLQAQSLGAIAAAANMTAQQWYHIADAAGIPIN